MAVLKNLDRIVYDFLNGVAVARLNQCIPTQSTSLIRCDKQGKPAVTRYKLRVLWVTDGSGSDNRRIFGSGLTSCAGLTAWPIFGSSFKNATGATEFAFRAMTVDSATCGLWTTSFRSVASLYPAPRSCTTIALTSGIRRR